MPSAPTTRSYSPMRPSVNPAVIRVPPSSRNAQVGDLRGVAADEHPAPGVDVAARVDAEARRHAFVGDTDLVERPQRVAGLDDAHAQRRMLVLDLDDVGLD